MRTVIINLICLIALIVLGIWNLGCKPGSNPVADCPRDAYLPLSLGSTWTFDVYDLDSNGAKIIGSKFVQVDSLATMDTIGGRISYTIVDARNPSVVVWRLSHSNGCRTDSYDSCGCDLWRPFGIFNMNTIGLLDSSNSTGPQLPIVDSNGNIKFFERVRSDRFYNRGTVSVTVPRGTYQTLWQTDSTRVTLVGDVTFTDGSKSQASGEERYFASGIGMVMRRTAGRVWELVSCSIR